MSKVPGRKRQRARVHSTSHGRPPIAPLERKQVRAKLRELRQRYGYSEQMVASGLGITQPTYHLLEHGRTALSLSRLAQLAAFYQYPLELLAEGYTITPDEERTARAYEYLRGLAGDSLTSPAPEAPAGEIDGAPAFAAA